MVGNFLLLLFMSQMAPVKMICSYGKWYDKEGGGGAYQGENGNNK